MTIREAIKKSGTPVALSGASIDAAESLLVKGEKVRHAVIANCAIDGGSKASGTLAVTTHRVLFCTSTLGKVRSASLLYQDCIGLGDISGGVLQRLPISAGGVSLVVELAGKNLISSLQAAILSAVEAYPNQPDIVFAVQADVPATSEAVPVPQSSTVKICRACGDRLLAEARKCPSCGSKDLATVNRDDQDAIAIIRAHATGSGSKVAAQAAPSARTLAKERIAQNKADGIACCPKCGSTSLSANKKGFGLGKAAAGAFVAGPVGLVGGALGANKIKVTCLNCGHQFTPGKK